MRIPSLMTRRGPLAGLGGAAALAFALSLLGGCLTFSSTSQRRTTLVDYLYPDGGTPPELLAPARVELPVDVGIAFVPVARRRGAAWNAVSLQEEQSLLRVVAEKFRERPWVGRIQTIPSQYLSPGGGLRDLQQVGRLMDVDVMALVSIDQVQYTDPKLLSLTYLTIVGAYLIPGEKNETRTLIDLAAFDVESGAFLLRAPGSSHVTGRTTHVNVASSRRAQASTSFERAAHELAANLEVAIDDFTAEVSEGRREGVEVIDSEGVSLARGGGALGLPEALVALALAGFVVGRRGPSASLASTDGEETPGSGDGRRAV